MTIACKRTLKEKVYMAKLAVLISAPSMLTTHWPLSGGEDAALMTRLVRVVDSG